MLKSAGHDHEHQHAPFDRHDGCIPREVQRLSDIQRAIDTYFRIIGRIKLNNPVDRRNVQTTRCHIRTQKNTGFSVTELKERMRPFGLLLFALKESSLKNDEYHQGIDPT